MVSMVRPKGAIALVGVGQTKFYEHYVFKSDDDPFIPNTDVPRLKPVRLGLKNTAFFSDELAATIEALRQWRDAQHAAGLESQSQVSARHASEAAAKKRAEGGRRKRRTSHPENARRAAGLK